MQVPLLTVPVLEEMRLCGRVGGATVSLGSRQRSGSRAGITVSGEGPHGREAQSMKSGPSIQLWW
jgi:hypothetical protein